MLNINRIAIIGGGFSGTLLALNLLRHDGPGAILIERTPDKLARGVAYSTGHPVHLLNVRAGNMSAFPDEPGHFVEWLIRNGEGSAGAFVPRAAYGRYLAELLADARSRAPGRLEIISGEAVDIDPGVDGAVIRLSDGRTIAAGAAVLAPGNLPPHDLPALGSLSASELYLPHGWSPVACQGLSANDHVLLIGSGLTAIDVALSLDAEGFAGRIVALSRRGLHPRSHEDVSAAGPRAAMDKPAAQGAALVRHVRQRAMTVGWRSAVDEFRPYTQDIWRSADSGERGRFLRHLRPYWDVHRHRLAPQVARRIAAMVEEGRLRFLAGRLLDARLAGGQAQISWRPRNGAGAEVLRVRRVVNCTGPQGNLLHSRDRLLRRLTDRGLIRPDDLCLGIDMHHSGRVIGKDGQASDRIFAIGPMTRGAFWEIVAVPDLRQQSWQLARWLSRAHWVGGEGL